MGISGRGRLPFVLVPVGAPVTMTPFVILFAERSGSSFLQTMLTSHPQLVCHAEVFHLRRQSGKDGRRDSIGRLSKFADPARSREYLEELWCSEAPAATEIRAVGFKYKYPTQTDLYPEVWEHLRSVDERGALKVIHLKRLNLLKAAISKQNQQVLWEERRVANLPSSDEYTVGKLKLNISDACQYMVRRKAYLEAFERRIKNFRSRLDISYESLLEDKEETIKEVYIFLGVDTYVNTAPATKKLTADSLREALVNYDEVVHALSGTEFEEYLA